MVTSVAVVVSEVVEAVVVVDEAVVVVVSVEVVRDVLFAADVTGAELMGAIVPVITEALVSMDRTSPSGAFPALLLPMKNMTAVNSSMHTPAINTGSLRMRSNFSFISTHFHIY